jgi:hypothetical protein
MLKKELEVEGFESELILAIFFALGLYLVIRGKLNIEVNTGSFDANNKMNKVSSSLPIKTEGLVVRILGLIICFITGLFYFNVFGLGV